MGTQQAIGCLPAPEPEGTAVPQAPFCLLCLQWHKFVAPRLHEQLRDQGFDQVVRGSAGNVRGICDDNRPWRNQVATGPKPAMECVWLSPAVACTHACRSRTAPTTRARCSPAPVACPTSSPTPMPTSRCVAGRMTGCEPPQGSQLYDLVSPLLGCIRSQA